MSLTHLLFLQAIGAVCGVVGVVACMEPSVERWLLALYAFCVANVVLAIWAALTENWIMVAMYILMQTAITVGMIRHYRLRSA